MADFSSNSADAELEAKLWISQMTGISMSDNESLETRLKSGVILCHLMNRIQPGIITKVDDSKANFKQMENIKKFLKSCRQIGVKEFEVFETNDLFDGKDMRSVIRCILALKRVCYRENLVSTTSLQMVNIEEKITPVLERSPATIPSYDLHATTEIVQWIEAVLGVSNDIPPAAFAPCVKDGIILCNLVNTLKPGIVPKINMSDISYKARENIQYFLRACTALGVEESDLCEVVDVFEEKNTNRVVHCIFALGRAVQASLPDYTGPKLRIEATYVFDGQTGKPAPPEAESQARQWICEMTGEVIPVGVPLAARLQSGALLCDLVNAVVPGSTGRVEDPKAPFKQMENIKKFLQACRAAGLVDHELFETNDLFQAKDMRAVVNCILALKRMSSQGPLTDKRSAPKPAPPGSAAKSSHAGRNSVTGGPSALCSPDNDGDERKLTPEERQQAIEREAEQVLAWMEAVYPFSGLQLTPSNMMASLRDGTHLCHFVNQLRPGSVPVVLQKDVAYKARENLQEFLRACSLMGVPDSDLFEMLDFVDDNRGRVIRCLIALAKAFEICCPGKGPKLRLETAKQGPPTKLEPEAEVRQWMCETTGVPLPQGDTPSLATLLHDGVLLCELMNKLVPGCIKKIDPSKAPFKQMENIKKFLQACRGLGLESIYIFETNDLFENKDMRPVINCLLALRRRFEARTESAPEPATVSDKSAGVGASTEGVAAVAEGLVDNVQPSSATTPSDGSPIRSSPACPPPRFTAQISAASSSADVSPSRPAAQASPARIITADGLGNNLGKFMSPSRLHELLEAALVQWIEAVLGCARIDTTHSSLLEILQDGVILCKLANSIRQYSVIKINYSDLKVKIDENISNFFEFLTAVGVPSNYYFQPDDLRCTGDPEKAKRRVIRCLCYLGHHVHTVPGYRGAVLEDFNLAFEGDTVSVVKRWLYTVTGCDIGDEALAERLKDGVLLCELMNKLVPGCITKIEIAKLPFKQMENIKKFLQACRTAGLSDHELFETNDLFQAKNMKSVVNCLLALKRQLWTKQRVGTLRVDDVFEEGGVPVSMPDLLEVEEQARIFQEPDGEELVREADGTGSENSDGAAVLEDSVVLDEAEVALLTDVLDEADVEAAIENTLRLQAAVVAWIEEVLWCVKLDVASKSLSECLRDGVSLCQLVNSIRPGTVPHIYPATTEEDMRRNLQSFTRVCRDWGVPAAALLDADELHRNENNSGFLRCLEQLGSIVRDRMSDYQGPRLKHVDTN